MTIVKQLTAALVAAASIAGAAGSANAHGEGASHNHAQRAEAPILLIENLQRRNRAQILRRTQPQQLYVRPNSQIDPNFTWQVEPGDPGPQHFHMHCHQVGGPPHAHDHSVNGHHGNITDC